MAFYTGKLKMKVKDLIEELKKYPPDAEVRYWNGNGEEDDFLEIDEVHYDDDVDEEGNFMVTLF